MRRALGASTPGSCNLLVFFLNFVEKTAKRNLEPEKILDKPRKSFITSSLSLSLKCALRESGCRIGYDSKKMSRYHFWQSMSRDANVEVLHCPPCITNS